MMCKDIYKKYSDKLKNIVSIEDEISIILLRYKYDIVKSDKTNVCIRCHNAANVYNYLNTLQCFNLQIVKNDITISYKDNTADNSSKRTKCIVDNIKLMFQKEMSAYANSKNIFSSSSKLSDEMKSMQKQLLKDYKDALIQFDKLVIKFKVK